MFANLVRARRRRLGLTQEELAEATGLSVSNIRKLEAGRTASPRPVTVRLLADALGLTGVDRDHFHEVAAGGTGDQPRPTTTPVVPAQLPPDVAAFIGRGEHLARLEDVLANNDPPTAVLTFAIGGSAGVGKTALAVHAAHRLAGRYPDGQLFIDLRGFTEGASPVDPADALDRLLRTLGVPAEQIPAELDDRAGLWRTVLAGRRVLIVLDNVATEAQATPLLPGTPGCLVLLTGRRQLAGMGATGTISLDMLSLADAVDLFIHLSGRDSGTDQARGPVAEVVELCGRLPLAIRIAAARLRSRPAWSAVDLVERLREQDQRLAELDDGTRSVTAALELSYQQLSPDGQRLFRLLGLHPGVDFDRYAAAALADASLARTGRLLDQLLDAHLLQEPTIGRYQLHDLVREFAAHAAVRDEPGRRAATGRLLDYYRHTAAVAMDLAYPFERGRRPRFPPAGTPFPDLPGPEQASSWLNTELSNLLAAADHAAGHDWTDHSWHLPTVLARHLYTLGRYRDLDNLHRHALTAARASANRVGELDSLIVLGWTSLLQGRDAAGLSDFRQALHLAEATAAPDGRLRALSGLGWVYLVRDRYHDAIANYQRALALTPIPGHEDAELYARNGLGWACLNLSQPEQAAHQFQRALQIARTTGHQVGEMDVWSGLGNAHLRQGHHRQALLAFEQALDLALTIGNWRGERDALIGLGDVHQARDEHERAADYHRRARSAGRSTVHGGHARAGSRIHTAAELVELAGEARGHVVGDQADRGERAH